MLKIIAIIVTSCIAITGGIIGYYFYSKPNIEITDFAKKMENKLNKAFLRIEDTFTSETIFRNMIKFKSKPVVCNAKRNKVTCISDRLYLGMPFSSYDAKTFTMIINFDKEDVFSTTLNIDGIFELEDNPYTNYFKKNASLTCSVISQYDKENGILNEKTANCKSNFDTFNFDFYIDNSLKREEFKNQNIYNVASIYFGSINYEESTQVDISTNEMAYNTISFSIESSKGIFNNIFEYADNINRKAISKEKIIEDYNLMREKILQDIEYEEIYGSDNIETKINELTKQLFKALDGVIYYDYKKINVDIVSKDNSTYYLFDDFVIENLIDDYNITIESN